MTSKGNAPRIAAGLVGMLVFAVVTYVVTEVAGGTKVESGYSNTPNGVVPGPPDFR